MRYCEPRRQLILNGGHLTETQDEFQAIREKLSPKQNMDVSNEDEREAQAEAIFETIRDMVDAGVLAKRQLHVDTIAETLTERFDIADKDDAVELVRARANDLVEIMHRVPTSTVDWRRKALYRELKAVIESEEEADESGSPMETKSSDGEEEEQEGEGEGEDNEEEQEEDEEEENQEVGEEEEEVEEGTGEEIEEVKKEESSSEEESEEETPPPRGRRRRVRKSILRPMTVSAKGAGKRNKMIDPQDSDEEADDTDPETPTKRGGHQLIHDPLSVRTNGNAHSSPNNSSGIKKLTLRDSLDNPEQSAMEASDDSSMEHLNGDELPPDSWVCLVEGCGKTVYKASSKRGKETIEDHSLLHAEDTRSKLDLVFAEHRLNLNMPVDNLISRIRGYGAVQSEEDEITDLPSPKRVKE